MTEDITYEAWFQDYKTTAQGQPRKGQPDIFLVEYRTSEDTAKMAVVPANAMNVSYHEWLRKKEDEGEVRLRRVSFKTFVDEFKDLTEADNGEDKEDDN